MKSLFNNPLFHVQCVNCGRTLFSPKGLDWGYFHVCKYGCDPDTVVSYQISLMIKNIEARMALANTFSSGGGI